MNAITLSGPVADALGWTLVHAVWQGFALVLPIAILLHVLRNRSSALRYWMGVAGLLSQVLTSVVTFSWLYKPAAAVSAVTMTGQAPQTLLVNWQTLPQMLSWPVQVQQFLGVHLSEFVLLYIIGVAVFVLRLAGGWLYLQRLSQTATIPVSDRLDALVQSLRTVMQLGLAVRVRESARVAVPMVVGMLKPVLLLPIGLTTNLSMAEVEAVLAHELAHVKRHDYAVNLLQSVVEVLYFFHPALWWLSARVREEREHCCDDLAVQTIGGNARILAQALAHVEEFRLSQLTLTQLATPALAMALTSKRQLLLHRVRRVLGVPTRPYVSNGSLAGLTLATLLLLSVSVYAVQQQPQPKPTAKTTQPKSTRRHKVDSNTEFGISDNKTLNYVIWKGQKLPASHVAKLQKLHDQVMAGQLNLDRVKQPNRDILLQIIETNYSFGKGMDGLSEGLAQIDYSNIVASTLTNIPLSPDGTVEGLARVNYDSIIRGAMTTVSADTSRLNTAQRQLEALTKKMQEIIFERQPVIDRLSKELTELTLKNDDWQKMTEQLVWQQSALAKQQNALAKQQGALAQKLTPLHTEIARLSLQRTLKANQLIKQKQLQSDLLEKQMDQLGERMGELGSKMGELGSQMQPLDAKLKPRQQRVGILADSISKLVEPASELSQKIGELSNQIAEEANKQAETAMKQAEAAMRLAENININTNNLTPSARAPRPPKAIRGVGIIKPVPPVPALPPVTPPAPRPAPKP